MGLGIGRALAAPLLLFNFVVYMIILGIAGWALNKTINNQQGQIFGNNASLYFIIFALIAGVVGLASVFAGLHHLKSWRAESLGAAIATALAALLLTLLAFGLACKEIHTSKNRGRKLKVLEAFVIIAAASELLYYMILHAGHVNNRYGPSYNAGHNTGAGTGYGNTDKPAV